jgi:hypothetical protein
MKLVSIRDLLDHESYLHSIIERRNTSTTIRLYRTRSWSTFFKSRTEADGPGSQHDQSAALCTDRHRRYVGKWA